MNSKEQTIYGKLMSAFQQLCCHCCILKRLLTIHYIVFGYYLFEHRISFLEILFEQDFFSHLLTRENLQKRTLIDVDIKKFTILPFLGIKTSQEVEKNIFVNNLLESFNFEYFIESYISLKNL